MSKSIKLSEFMKEKAIPFVDIVSLGTDGIDDLTIKEIEIALSDIDGVIIGLLKQTNFNSDKNVHHNIFINNANEEFAMIYANKWEPRSISEILHIVIIHKCIDAKKILEKTKNIISPEQVAKVERLVYNLTLSPNNDKYFSREKERVLEFMCQYKQIPEITYQMTLHQQSERHTSKKYKSGWDRESAIFALDRTRHKLKR